MNLAGFLTYMVSRLRYLIGRQGVSLPLPQICIHILALEHVYVYALRLDSSFFDHPLVGSEVVYFL